MCTGHTERAGVCMFFDCVSHIHVQHGHACPQVVINNTYKAKIVEVPLVV